MNESLNEKELFTNINDALIQIYADLAYIYCSNEEASEIGTGFSDLDRMIGGMKKYDLIVIGGRPGMGKTVFALNIALSAAKKYKKKVCIFSLEIAAKHIVSRMLTREAMVDSYSLRNGDLRDDDWARMAYASGELADCDILIDDTPNISVNEMRTKLRKIRNPGLIVIDYLQLISGGEKFRKNRNKEIRDIAYRLKLLAQEFHVPVICCTQLPRIIEHRENNRPRLSDLRFMGNIDRYADTVMLLYRDNYYHYDYDNVKDTAEIIVAKNSHGDTGTVEIGWDGQHLRFYDKIDTE